MNFVLYTWKNELVLKIMHRYKYDRILQVLNKICTPKFTKAQPKRSLGDFVTPCYKLFVIKDVFFHKDQLGIGVWCRKPQEIGQNWILEPIFSEI